MSHTPGPLIAFGMMIKDTTETVGGMHCIQHAETNKRGKTVGTGMSLGYAYNREDAVLWAAAPELLMACKAVAHFPTVWANDPTGEVRKQCWAETLTDLKAAIAKAENTTKQPAP